MPDSFLHPTAIVAPGAELGVAVTIGAYAIIEADTRIGDGCIIDPHAQILPGTRLGPSCRVGRGAIIGGDPQSLSFDPRTRTFVEIGARNVLREHVTIHRATVDGGATRLGDDNFLMVGSHVGHDATVGAGNVIANAVLLAGHVELGNQTYLGGASVFHQFVRVGDHCMVQGNSSISQDIPHYMTTSGLNVLVGLNVIGLRRAGFGPGERREIKRLYRMLFVANRNTALGLARAREAQWGPPALRLLEFVAAASQRGLCTPGRGSGRARSAAGTGES